MLNLAKGYKISNPKELNEGFEFTDDVTINANVNVEKILDVFQHFICIHDEPMFFILELPVEEDRENPIAPGVLNETHKDVFYIDGCSKEECLVLLDRYSELLINDGMNIFGFGCHESDDEMLLGKYNNIIIFSKEISKYDDFFEPHQIPKFDNLVMAWDIFTDENPGISDLIEVNGKSVYDLPKELEDWGIYLAETREE